jgi:peptidyl-prolyl cis-trans isomerase B (cyclophilin B)
MKKGLCVLLGTCLLFLSYACGGNNMETVTENAVVTIEVEGFGNMVIELFFDKAPNTVRNFVHLIQGGYFDGSTFHRVIENFMIQGGSGSKEVCAIKGEFTSNGFENNLLHERGVISMARTSYPNTATSQFFIVHKNSSHLDGKYAAFGKMISGFAVLDAIATVATNRSDAPLASVIITKITVDTKGVTYLTPICA